MQQLHYPFVAMVGQEELQLGIVLNIINPKLGGLLIKGVKGSGKSTAVYSMTDIIPPITIMKECQFNCNPQTPENWCEDCKIKYQASGETVAHDVEIVAIPLSITEDSLLGNIDVELLLKEGKYRFIPGLLAKAHRQILYIDEVNLLPDHIVDDILDVAAMGWNKIEREGFSISHLSKFLLIGTMNPEEGELRPQILDRFPLSVEVKSVTNQILRKEIINRNLAYEKDAIALRSEFSGESNTLKNMIKLARDFLEEVTVEDYFYDIVVKFCAKNQVDGHRADISIIKTAKTHAAFELRKEVELRHIQQAAKFVLSHRTRHGGLSKPLTQKEIDDYFQHVKRHLNDIQKHADKDAQEGHINREINLFSGEDLIQPSKKV